MSLSCIVVIFQNQIHVINFMDINIINHTKGHLFLKLTKMMSVFRTTVRYRYNAVNFLSNPNKRHPIARPWGRVMGCLLWFWSLIYVLLLSSQCRWKYCDKLDRVITALDCTRIISASRFQIYSSERKKLESLKSWWKIWKDIVIFWWICVKQTYTMWTSNWT